jgi:1-pyrroline-5-carboxylate dehydrogenase
MSQSTNFKVGNIVNEPIYGYLKGSKDKQLLKEALKKAESEIVEVPCIIGGKEIKTGNIFEVRMPHDHQHVIARVHLAGKEEVKLAVEASLKAKKEWEALDWSERAKIFMKAADLLAGPWRYVINAATMLGQSKNAFQAEVDSACEMIDFFRFNAQFYEKILADQPLSVSGIHNSVDYRPLEGFIFAVTPFNFTAIAGNLPAAPAMVGNTVVWKPSEQQCLAAYRTMQLFIEAGLPAGVINFVPALGPVAGEVCLTHPDLAGVHFTGSSATFNHIQKTIGTNIETYKSYPRVVGETGGKDFVFSHPSADLEVLNVALIRGAFEYQGQKCSAASRAYIPASLWSQLEPKLKADVAALKMGDVRDFRNLITAVIDERSFNKIKGYIEDAKKDPKVKIIAGGECDSSKGYFIRPTIIQTTDPKSRTMQEEIFGPVLTIYVYEDSKLLETLKLCNETSPYALTGAIISQDRNALHLMMNELRHAAGNFYINDKPTGAVVGQQPFGGARRSGTNDKAGSSLNITRWMSMRTIKENFVPPKSILYPYMDEE